MPYITPDRRAQIDPQLVYLIGILKTMSAEPEERSKRKGDLNYVFCRLVLELFKGGYNQRSDGLAALRDAEAELRRRWLDPYEDLAIQKNGDFFPPLEVVVNPSGNSLTRVSLEQHPALDQFYPPRLDPLSSEGVAGPSKR